MSYAEALESHLHQSLCKGLRLSSLDTDADGDYVLEVDGVRCWVESIESADGPLLARAWSRAAVGVRRNAKVLGELNDANAEWSQVRCLWVDQKVFVAGEIELESVETDELARLIRSVAAKAEHLGELIAAVHGGTPAFAAASPSEQMSFDLDQHPPTSPKS